MNQKGFASIIAAVLILIGILAALAYYYGRGSGKVVTEARTVSGFSKISLKGTGNLKISQGLTEAVRIEAEDNLIKKLQTEVKDDTLHLSYKLQWPFWSVWPTKDINIFVTVKDLTKISVSGSGNIEGNDLALQDLEITISGSGNVNLGLTATKIVSRISGSGKFQLRGTVENQEIEIDGSGAFGAKELVTQKTNIDISGSGKAEVNAQQNLDVKISGSGTVRYLGNPAINQSISGSGKIERLQ